MKSLLEPKASVLTIPYQPDGGVSAENPPRFTWMPEQESETFYRLQICGNREFAEQDTITFDYVPYNFFTPDMVLERGQYYWRYSLSDADCSYSKIRTFEIGPESVKNPLVSRRHRYDTADMAHPRIWLNPDGIRTFVDCLKEDKDYCGFHTFLLRSVCEYEGKELIREPMPYPEHKRVLSLWRQNYMDCQQALCHIRALAVAGTLLEREDLKEQAKTALLWLAQWDADGPTARDYNDECAFRVAYALAFGYDWLYDILSEEERQQVRAVLFARTRQVADHIMVKTRIHYSLYDSHAVRSLSSVIVPCCIVLLGEYEEVGQWLDYAIEYFHTIYTPWGDRDGGWAEGPAYWTTGMAFVTEAINTIKNFTHIDLYQRPFFQKTGDFPLYCNPVDTYFASFCDQSNLGEYPGHKTAYNIRQFAGVTGNENYQWYYDAIFRREPEINQDFYNKGWWDFYFDDMVYRFDYGHKALEQKEEPERLKWFRDIGWVAINDHMKDLDQHVFFLTKSSPYGSVSHSQGDQNTFVLFAYGEPFIINSGYYIGFNSSMHRNWRRQTKSHNTILIDGKGQYGDMDKVKQLGAKGCICEAIEEQGYLYIREDATEAYRESVPGIQSYTREIYYADQEYFILVDTVETREPSRIDWRLHSLSPFAIEGQRFTVSRDRGSLNGTIVYCSSGTESMEQTDVFEGVDPQELAGLEKQWHLNMKTGVAGHHVIVSLMVPEKKHCRKLVNTIKDDQGMDIFYYFESDGAVITVRVDGNVRH